MKIMRKIWEPDLPITRCSFCQKRQTDVEHIFAGREVIICNECVDTFHGWIHDPQKERNPEDDPEMDDDLE